MQKVMFPVIVVLLAVMLISCQTKSTGKTLVIVGDKEITEGDLDLISNINPRIKAQLASEFGRKKILDNLVEQELFYQASLKEGLDKDPLVKDKIDIYRKVIISQAFMDKKLEDEARKYYEEHKNEFEKLKLSHIMFNLISDKKDKSTVSEKVILDLANNAKKRIEGGEKFEDVAKELFEDNMTKSKGGDLGFASKDEARLTRRGFGPLLEKAFSAKVGEVLGPIKTENGYHLVMVTKGSELQRFEDVLQGILFKIRAKARTDILAELKKKYKIEFAGAKKDKEKKPAEAKKADEKTTGEAKPAEKTEEKIEEKPEDKPEAKTDKTGAKPEEKSSETEPKQ